MVVPAYLMALHAVACAGDEEADGGQVVAATTRESIILRFTSVGLLN
jgi:hypothetical protein